MGRAFHTASYNRGDLSHKKRTRGKKTRCLTNDVLLETKASAGLIQRMLASRKNWVYIYRHLVRPLLHRQTPSPCFLPSFHCPVYLWKQRDFRPPRTAVGTGGRWRGIHPFAIIQIVVRLAVPGAGSTAIRNYEDSPSIVKRNVPSLQWLACES